MIARRLTGILLSLLTLNVIVLGADVSCAKHATSGNHAMTAMQPSTATRAMTVAMSDKGEQHAPCELPSKSDCCSALASCSVVFQASDAFAGGTPVQMRNVIASSASTTPLSEIVTPDPPPPKG